METVNNMKILYDDQIFSMMTHGGVARYFYELMKNLNEIGVNTELPLFFSNNYYLKNKDISNHFSSLPFSLKILNRTLPKFNRYYSKRALIKQDYDVFHPTFCSSYFGNYLKEKPFVITVHHLNTLSTNNLFAHGEKELIMKANHIIAVSKATKEDILRYTSVDENKITVIHHGNSLLPSSFCNNKSNKHRKPYFLYVGGRYEGKNFQFLLNALKVISAKYDVSLLCTGSSFSSSEKKMIAAMNLSDRVKGFVIKDDSEMYQLYSNALCFVFPSLKEGFGMPILESFSCKCPVLLSNVSCLPEIAGDAGLYFDPYDLDSLIDGMLRILSSTSLRDELINKGIEREKQFSWRTTAEKTLRVYESVL
jgi:glycosyltransferase involved in cell wall biosynthesis